MLGPPWTDGGADRGGAGARRHAHQSSASDRSGAPKLTGGGTGSSARASPEVGRWRSDRATVVAQCGHGKLGREGFWRGRGEEKGAVRCGVLRGSSGGFYRAEGGRREGWSE
jgi:hypothetical protein